MVPKFHQSPIGGRKPPLIPYGLEGALIATLLSYCSLPRGSTLSQTLAEILEPRTVLAASGQPLRLPNILKLLLCIPLVYVHAEFAILVCELCDLDGQPPGTPSCVISPAPG